MLLSREPINCHNTTGSAEAKRHSFACHLRTNAPEQFQSPPSTIRSCVSDQKQSIFQPGPLLEPLHFAISSPPAGCCPARQTAGSLSISLGVFIIYAFHLTACICEPAWQQSSSPQCCCLATLRPSHLAGHFSAGGNNPSCSWASIVSNTNQRRVTLNVQPNMCTEMKSCLMPVSSASFQVTVLMPLCRATTVHLGPDHTQQKCSFRQHYSRQTTCANMAATVPPKQVLHHTWQ